MAEYVQPKAAWQLMLDGKDLADKLNPRLISLRLSEKRGEEADELEIELHDHDGALALPPNGARLVLSLGWERGSGVAVGLVAKGSFVVDEVSWSGPPDKVSIKARSADFKDSFRTRRSQIWKDTTLGAIIGAIAGRQALTARCHADLSGKAVTAAEQHNKSDMQFLRDLGRRYDAVATVKDKCLIFAPVGATTTATGKPIPSITLTRQSGDSYEYRRAERQGAQDGAEAQYHDQDGARRHTAQSGGTRRRRLRRVYASHGDASAAAGAERNRIARAAASFNLGLAYGNAAIAPGAKASASGFKADIDGKAWTIASVSHEMDASGFRTRIEMEVAA